MPRRERAILLGGKGVTLATKCKLCRLVVLFLLYVWRGGMVRTGKGMMEAFESIKQSSSSRIADYTSRPRPRAQYGAKGLVLDRKALVRSHYNDVGKLRD